MELTATPIVRRPLEDMPAPGYTDFTRIYIASELNAREYRTVLRHEQAHVWARHNMRRPKDAKDELWRAACEMEIARTIYDEQDIETIKAPRSRLSSGCLPDSIEGLPEELNMAEDIYAWLLENNPAPMVAAICGCSCQRQGDGDQPDGSLIPSKELIQSILQQMNDSEKSSQASESVKSSLKEIKQRTPSLVASVDACLRHRMMREPSYMRPSRRDIPNFLAKGNVSRPRPPLVEVFVDRSGSFTPEKTRQAQHVVEKILARYRISIRSDVWFFGNDCLVPNDLKGGGNTPYHLIHTHLRISKPAIAIIITDDDGVSSSVSKLDQATRIICVPIGTNRTQLAAALGGVDVSW